MQGPENSGSINGREGIKETRRKDEKLVDLFRIRKRFQDFKKSVKDAHPEPVGPDQLSDVKDALSAAFRFDFDQQGLYFSESKIESALKPLTIYRGSQKKVEDKLRYDPKVVGDATTLYEKWKDGNFTPSEHPPMPSNAPDSAQVSHKTTQSAAKYFEGTRAFRDRGKETTPRKANVFGHNGLRIGDWWLNRDSARKDGAHGQRVAGIHGSKHRGAYSIVLSQNAIYDNIDRDGRDRVFYSGPQGVDKYGSQALMKSHETRGPVRLIRTANEKYPGLAPRFGLRYDGLYCVTNYTEKAKEGGGSYLLFTLERMGDQREIDTSRPNTQERLEYQEMNERF